MNNRPPIAAARSRRLCIESTAIIADSQTDLILMNAKLNLRDAGA
jgi:hypothetical protein